MSMIRALAIATVFFLHATLAQAVTRDDFLYGNSEPDDSGLPFRYFVPPGYDAAQSYPLILFLHGSGERGDDNEAQLNNNANGALQLLGDDELALQPVFMIAPQCPANDWWSGGTLLTAIGLIDQLAADYSIDPDRVYITGLSMGGMGTWSAVTAQPGRFAAAVPMSGNGDTGPASAVSAVPFWFFHAANDGTVGVAGSDSLVAALRNAGANTIYTRYDSGGHTIWSVAYAHPLLFPWLVAQRRGTPAAGVPPLLRITTPTSDPAWTTDASSIALGGIADNDGHPIDTVAWDVLGGASGSATGTIDWSSADIALADGISLFRVTASAPSLSDDYGGLTTFNDSLRVSRTGPPPEPGSVIASINAGGDAYTAADGTVYSADTAFDGGSTQVSDHAIAGSDDAVLYNHWRWGEFAYRLPVAAGTYRVELQFADTYNSAPGQRIFDVAIEGATVLDDFDIIAAAGVDTAVVRTFDVNVSDGVLDIVFSNGSAGSARVDALRVIRGDGDRLFADGFDAN